MQAKLDDLETQGVFRQLIEEDESWLREQWQLITAEISKVESDQRELNARRERLEARRAVLDGIARLRQVEFDAENPPPPRPAGNSSKDVCLQIMRSSPEEVWTAGELHVALKEHGVQTSASNVRMILRRLVDEGALRHVARGQYSLVASYRLLADSPPA